VLSIDVSGTIVQQPHPCLDALCQPLASMSSTAPIDLEAGSMHELPGVAETSLRLRATFTRGQSTSVSLMLRRSPNGEEQTEILYDWEQERLTLDRTKSSLDPTVRRNRQETAYATAEKNCLHLHVFLDRSVLEVFVDKRAAFAARIYPTLPGSAGVAFAAAGNGARVESLSLARLQRPV
jgi:beta-fructofuranosidase